MQCKGTGSSAHHRMRHVSSLFQDEKLGVRHNHIWYSDIVVGNEVVCFKCNVFSRCTPHLSVSPKIYLADSSLHKIYVDVPAPIVPAVRGSQTSWGKTEHYNFKANS